MLVGGVGDMGGAGAGTAGQGEAGVRITGNDWIRAGEAGPEVRAKGAGLEGRDAKSSGSEVSDGDGDDRDVARLAVEEVWRSCSKYTQLATLVEDNNRLLSLY